MRWFHVILVLVTSIVGLADLSSAAERWTRVGVARVNVTPEHPTLLAGYGGRTGEYQGIDHPIWARALAIGEDDPVVVVAVDNCGVPAAVTRVVATELAERHGMTRDRLVICSTHTHNAPTLTGYAPVVWGGRASADQVQRVNRYTQWLTRKIIEAASAALRDRREARLSWGQGMVRFGGNRRVLSGKQWAGFGFQSDGPVDHSLPIMVAHDRKERPIAVWTNYACHCTTVGSRNHVGGDWAGFSNTHIEEKYPSAVALTTIGCGADVGPQPGGNLELASQHGAAIAGEVERLLKGPLTELTETIAAEQRMIQLPLARSPGKEHFERLSQDAGFHGYHARQMLKQLENQGQLATHVDYPVTCWKFGEELAIVFLAGEVVVDYAVRLKTEMDWSRLWINGWSNDVPSYIPSRRILAEGGYEAGFSQIYYELPTHYDPALEDLIVGTVRKMVGNRFGNPAGQKKPTFLEFPGGKEWFAERVNDWAKSLSPRQREQYSRIRELARHSQNGFDRLVTKDPKEDTWFNYSGRKENRPYIRQQEKGDLLAWKTVGLQPVEQETVVLVFAGGLGWISQPATAGFQMTIGGQHSLQLDVTLAVNTWKSADQRFQLHYFPTWQSDVDSGGLFYLVMPRNVLPPGQSVLLEVASLGSGSQRWFSVDRMQDVKEIEKLVLDALQSRQP
jgi:neutral ceramidase